MNDQQKYLDELCLKCFPEPEVAIDYYNSTTEKYQPGIRYSKTKYEIHDERTVFLNEIVFDLDYSSYLRNYSTARLLLDVFEMRGINPVLCASGGKGIHIHIFFNKINFTSDNNKEVLKEAFSYNLSWKHIRMWFFNKILDEAGIDSKEIGAGKNVDTLPNSFDHYEGTTRLIRDIGGRKFVKHTDGQWRKYYKTYIPLEEFNNRKPNVVQFENVRYPPVVEPFNIDENEFLAFLQDYIKYQKENKFERLNNEKLPIDYINIEGVLKVREGLSTGQRNYGALVISTACKIDRMTRPEAREILKEYVDNCSQSEHPFNINEAEQWLNWIYSQDKVYWNCSLLNQIGVHDRHTCEFCRTKNRSAIEFLSKTTIIKQIKEVLDETVVGEDDTKLLIFLLLLSKDFPSETGLPGWNLPGDPMSQNILLSGDSSAGKSYIIKQILKLFGNDEEDFFVISRMTKNAINYYTEQNMDRKIVFIEELQGLDENTSQLRVWMSEGKLTLKTVEKVKNAEGIEVNRLVKQTTKGQPCFISCQAEGKIEDQLNNRSWILGVDVSEFQTSSILEYQSRVNQGKILYNPEKVRNIQDALKQLKPYHFKIPFADFKLMGIPTKDVRSRRDYEKFLTLIKCSAYLHQQQRDIVEEEGKECLICDIKDYEIAKQYSQSILGATFSGLTNTQIDLINYIKKSSWRDEFTVSDIMRNLGKSHTYWHNNLRQLEDLGFVSGVHSVGKSSIFRLVEEKSLNIINLPSGEELLERVRSQTNDL